MHKIFKNKKGAFSLIELLVVLIIVAILATLIVPSLSGVINKSKISADESNCAAMQEVIDRWTLEADLYLESIASLPSVSTEAAADAQIANMTDMDKRVYNILVACMTAGGVTTPKAKAMTYTFARGYLDNTANTFNARIPLSSDAFQTIIATYSGNSDFTPKQNNTVFKWNPTTGKVTVAVKEEGDTFGKVTVSAS